MRQIFTVAAIFGVMGLLFACQKTRDVNGLGVNALSVSVEGSRIDSFIKVVVKNNYPALNSITHVDVKSPYGSLLGQVTLENNTGSVILNADSLYPYAKMSGSNYALTSAPRNEIQIENIQFLVKEKPECSRLATLLIPPSIIWTPYVIAKDQSGQDSIKNITAINMQTPELVYLQYKLNALTGAQPGVFKITLKHKSGSTTKTINYNYRSFKLEDTIQVIGANYNRDDELTFGIEVQNGKYKDVAEFLTNTGAAQKLARWTYSNEVKNLTISGANSSFNLFTGQLAASPAAGNLVFTAPDKVEATSNADTLVTLFRYTGDDSYKAYADNDAWKAYDKFVKGSPVTSVSGVGKNNGIVSRMIIKAGGKVINEQWGLVFIQNTVVTPGSESILFNYRYNPKKY